MKPIIMIKDFWVFHLTVLRITESSDMPAQFFHALAQDLFARSTANIQRSSTRIYSL